MGANLQEISVPSRTSKIQEESAMLSRLTWGFKCGRPEFKSPTQTTE